MDGVAIPTPRIQRETAKLQIEQQQTNLSTQTTGSLKSRDVNMSVSSFLTSGIIQFKWKLALGQAKYSLLNGSFDPSTFLFPHTKI